MTPGASVTLLDVGTKAVRTAVTDARGGFTFPGLFPGTFDLTIELAGFKTFQQTAIVLGPNDVRGLDIQLELGAQSETVVVETPADIVQTETGAREGRLSAAQIDNLSIIGRSSLELLRILPGVVAPDQHQLESVSFLGGANATQTYAINGIRTSNNAVSLDGSNLIDIGANNSVMLNVNNDMVQEVKVQSSNFNAEYGSGAVNISAVTKGGSSEFHGTGYWYGRDHRLAANDRSNAIVGIEKPRSGFFYPGGNVGGPIPLPFTSYNSGRDRLFFWVGVEAQRQKIDSGSTLTTTISQAARSGDLSEFLAGRGQNLNHPSVVFIPGGFPGAGTPAPNNDLRPYVDPLGAGDGQPLSAAQLFGRRQSLQLRVQRARANQPVRDEGACGLEHQREHEGVRAQSLRTTRTSKARAASGAADSSSCRLPGKAATVAARTRPTWSRC